MTKQPRLNNITDSVLKEIEKGTKRGIFYTWLIVIGLVWVFLGNLYAGIAVLAFLIYYVKIGRENNDIERVGRKVRKGREKHRDKEIPKPNDNN